MQLATSPTKARQIADLIENEILSGKLAPGARLHSIRNLCEKFSVSVAVINSAYNELEKKQLIVCQTGRGTYVSDNLHIHHQTFGLITSVRDIGSEGYFSSLMGMANTEQNMIFPITIKPDKGWEKDIDRLMTHNPNVVMIDLEGAYFELNKVISRLSEQQICFVNRWEWNEPLPSNAVLVDYRQMTIDTVEYLLKRGHRRILFLGHYAEPRPFKQQNMEVAANAVGLKFPSFEFEYACFRDFVDNPGRIKRIFEHQQAPTAIFSRSDSILFEFFSKIKALYPSCSDTELIGCHNTMWSRIPNYEFSTYKIDFELMWQTSMHKFDWKNGSKDGVQWIVPEFIKR